MSKTILLLDYLIFFLTGLFTAAFVSGNYRLVVGAFAVLILAVTASLVAISCSIGLRTYFRVVLSNIRRYFNLQA